MCYDFMIRLGILRIVFPNERAFSFWIYVIFGRFHKFSKRDCELCHFYLSVCLSVSPSVRPSVSLPNISPNTVSFLFHFSADASQKFPSQHFVYFFLHPWYMPSPCDVLGIPNLTTAQWLASWYGNRGRQFSSGLWFFSLYFRIPLSSLFHQYFMFNFIIYLLTADLV